jgi:hypothetical protein
MTLFPYTTLVRSGAHRKMKSKTAVPRKHHSKTVHIQVSDIMLKSRKISVLTTHGAERSANHGVMTDEQEKI